MQSEKITVQTTLSVDKKKAWEFYTHPKHITQWNFADASWHCPAAKNELVVGGEYFARMEAKDGSFGFDFTAKYVEIKTQDYFIYTFGGREAEVRFKEVNGQTEIRVTFDPETENDRELQKKGWQAILDNFKKYTESH